MQQYFILFITVVTVFFGSISCNSTDADCAQLSNKDCRTCLSLAGCAFCKNGKSCFLYDVSNVIAKKCAISDTQWGTCVGTFETWIIIVSVVGGILLIAILIAICCVCRKCKRCSIRKEEKRQAREQDVENRRAEERRAAGEIRSTERNRVADEIRMKYGILKEKENGTDYTRMD
ncbi:unnamed protein product [Rotaria socialis]|uniref:Pituitary tumor-transforming gene 1 protein-interacting protein n=1 Tax=Rotaria socialis TaxID=392032 RepID=A0A817UM54_9BILA|nr:unnamed protein product [Rotaria socialis]CAF3366306.1 unnamed protein product [Rotaria socialis]